MALDLDPREVDRFVRPMSPRQELIYLLAIRGLSARCGGDRQFRERTDALTARFRQELPDAIREADMLGAVLTASVMGKWF
jgi:hypothetical protein